MKPRVLLLCVAGSSAKLDCMASLQENAFRFFVMVLECRNKVAVSFLRLVGGQVIQIAVRKNTAGVVVVIKLLALPKMPWLITIRVLVITPSFGLPTQNFDPRKPCFLSTR